jgi:hypothetical protein
MGSTWDYCHTASRVFISALVGLGQEYDSTGLRECLQAPCCAGPFKVLL